MIRTIPSTTKAWKAGGDWARELEDEYPIRMVSWPKSYQELEAENAELRKDAERYRWLRILERKNTIIEWDVFPFSPDYEASDEAINDPALLMDEYIDAAMKEGK